MQLKRKFASLCLLLLLLDGVPARAESIQPLELRPWQASLSGGVMIPLLPGLGAGAGLDLGLPGGFTLGGEARAFGFLEWYEVAALRSTYVVKRWNGGPTLGVTMSAGVTQGGSMMGPVQDWWAQPAVNVAWPFKLGEGTAVIVRAMLGPSINTRPEVAFPINSGPILWMPSIDICLRSLSSSASRSDPLVKAVPPTDMSRLEFSYGGDGMVGARIFIH